MIGCGPWRRDVNACDRDDRRWERSNNRQKHIVVPRCIDKEYLNGKIKRLAVNNPYQKVETIYR